MIKRKVKSKIYTFSTSSDSSFFYSCLYILFSRISTFYQQSFCIVILVFILHSNALAQRLGTDIEKPHPSNNKTQRLVSNPRYIPIESGQRLGIQQVGEASTFSSRQLLVRSVAKNAENMIAKAERLLDEGQFEYAIEIYQKLLNTQPKSFNIRSGLSNALLETGQFDKAINQIQETINLFPDNLEAQLDLGVAFYRSGHIGEAIEQYGKVLNKSKNNFPLAHFNIAMAYAHQGNFSKAIENYQRAIEQHKKYPEAYNNMGLIYEVEGNLEEAITHFKLAIKENNGFYPLAHYNLGRFYHNQNDYDKALAEFQLALKQQVNFPEAYLEIGNIYLFRSILNNTNELERAITFYQKAIELRQNYYPLAHDNLAVTLTHQGKKELAIKHYRIAFEQYNGYCPETLENLIASLLDKNSFNIGNELSRSDNKGNLGNKKEVQGVNKRMLKLLNEYETLDENLKKWADVHYCIGLAYITTDNLEAAIDEFDQAIQISKNKDPEARDRLRFLLEILVSL